MAGLNRMWSHSCLSSKMPFCRLLRYLEKASTMSRTGRVTCTLEDCSADRETERESGDERWKERMTCQRKGVKDVEEQKGMNGVRHSKGKGKDTCQER